MHGSSANQDVFTTRELSGREIIIRGKITASCAISCSRESKGGRRGRERRRKKRVWHVTPEWDVSVRTLVNAPKINDQWRHGWFALLVHVTARVTTHARPRIIHTQPAYARIAVVKCVPERCLVSSLGRRAPLFPSNRVGCCRFAISEFSRFSLRYLGSALSLSVCVSHHLLLCTLSYVIREKTVLIRVQDTRST